MIAFSLTVAVLAVILAIRNEIVFKVRQRRLSEIHELNGKEIGRADFIAVMERRYEEFDHPSYNEMLFDVRCWVYRQFYTSEVV